MECVICGNHWHVLNENSIEHRAATGTRVDNVLQIENPDWQKEYRSNIAAFSKSAITSDVFDKQKQFSNIEPQSKQAKSSWFPVHVTSLSFVFLALIAAPQFMSTWPSSESGKKISGPKVDFTTTASLGPVEPVFKFSDIKLMKIVRGKTKYINVRANIRNISGEVVEPEEFQIFMKNAQGKTVQDFVHKVKRRTVKPGQSISIRSEIIDQSGSIKSVSIAFQK